MNLEDRWGAILEAADASACLQFLLGSTNEELAKLSQLVKEGFRLQFIKLTDERALLIHQMPDGEEKRAAIEVTTRKHRQSEVLALGILATGTLTEVRKLKTEPWIFQWERLPPLFLHVRPTWLPEFVEDLLRWRWTSGMSDYTMGQGLWILADKLISLGLVPEPATANYPLGMLAVSRAYRPRRQKGAVEFLSERPHLLKCQIWRLFEENGAGPTSLSTHDTLIAYPSTNYKEEHTWRYALIEKANAGLLDRTRLLNASISALTKEFTGGLPKWFCQFHEALNPTAEERIARTKEYLHLLSSNQAPTVNFALDAIEKLDGLSAYTPEDILAHLGPVLQSKHKSTAERGLKHLEIIAKNRSDLRGKVLHLAIDSFSIRSEVFQKRLLKLFALYSDFITPEICAGANDWLAGIIPSLSPAFRKLFGSTAEIVITSLAAQDHESAVTKIHSLRLGSDRQIIPIATTEELVQQSAYLIENFHDIEEAERIFSALVRFSHPDLKPKPRDLTPLIKRAKKILREFEKGTYRWVMGFPEVSMLMVTILEWAESKRHVFQPGFTHPALQFHYARLLAIRNTFFSEGKSLPLLSSPTHRGFWIDPSVLVARSIEWQTAGQIPNLYDQITALLRLPPEGRAAAVSPATQIEGEWGESFRYALNGNDPYTIGTTLPLWIAASRARNPGADDPVLLQAYPELGPGAGAVGRWDFRRRMQVITKGQSTETFDFVDYWTEVTPSAPPTIPFSHFSVHLHFRQFWEGNLNKRDEKIILINHPSKGTWLWLNALWPSDKEPMYGFAVTVLLHDVKYLVKENWGIFSVLDFLSDPNELFGPNALLFLAICLTALNHTEARMKAGHALHLGMSGPLRPDRLADALKKVVELELFSVSRFIRSLQDFSQTSSAHRKFAIDTVAALLTHSAEKIEGHARVFEFLLESLLETQITQHNPDFLGFLRRWIDLKKSDKSTKLCKKILERCLT